MTKSGKRRSAADITMYHVLNPALVMITPFMSRQLVNSLRIVMTLGKLIRVSSLITMITNGGDVKQYLATSIMAGIRNGEVDPTAIASAMDDIKPCIDNTVNRRKYKTSESEIDLARIFQGETTHQEEELRTTISIIHIDTKQPETPFDLIY